MGRYYRAHTFHTTVTYFFVLGLNILYKVYVLLGNNDLEVWGIISLHLFLRWENMVDWTILSSVSFVPFVHYFYLDFVPEHILGRFYIRSFSRYFRNMELIGSKYARLMKFLKFFLRLISEVAAVLMMDDWILC